ncbi:MAG: DUF3465 domain-containing protein [Lysobacter sp.]|nr:DUF3465 domain-containing protein [Lysobacter sp.]
MRKRHALPAIAAALLAAWLLLPQHQKGPAPSEAPVATQATSPGDHATREVTGSGTVIRVLPDDTRGERHQRFILRIASGETLLVAHNIDLAPRVEPLRIGDTIDYHGEYVRNPRGGVVHWTHRDPAGRHESGWLRREGRTFQ